MRRKGLDAAQLAAAIAATQTPSMRQAAAELGRTVRAEDGIGNALAQLRAWGLVEAVAEPLAPHKPHLWSVA